MVARALPSGLTNFSLNFKGGENIIDKGLKELSRALPSGVASLSLNFQTCWKITGEARAETNQATSDDRAPLIHRSAAGQSRNGAPAVACPPPRRMSAQ